MMKTILQNIKHHLLAAGFAVAAVTGAQAQCSTSTAVTYLGSGSITYTNSSTYTPGWNGYVTVSYGDGTSNYGSGSSSSGSHTYASNGTYLVSSHLYSYDPVDSSFNCVNTDFDTVVVNDIACSVSAGSIYQTQQGSNQLTYNIGSVVNTSQGYFMGYWVITDSLGNYIYSQSGGGLDNITYTFPTSGFYNIGFTASSYDSLTATSCEDSVYMNLGVGDTSLNPGGCNLQVNVNVTSTGGNSAVIFGYANNYYSASYLMVEGQYYYNTDSLYHTFSGPGNHYVCFYAEDSTQASYCYDSICVLYTIGANPSCSAAFYMWEDSLNAGQWHAVNYSSGTGPLTYTWDFGDGSTSTQAYPTHTYAVPGNYIICLTIADANGCSSSTCDSSAAFRMTQQMATQAIIGSFTVTAPAVGISENQSVLAETKVYPNPMAETSLLTFNSSLAANGKIEVVNMLGATVVSENVTITKGNNEFQLHTASLASGVYYVNVIAENKILKTLKAVK